MMIFEKKKAVIAAILSAAMTTTAIVPSVASAAGSRTKDEAFGDKTYAERFLSLYDDVITKGVENGYLSETNPVNGGFNIPYHAVEELIVEAPDYGHETTSEAMSYIVWMASMKDNITKNGNVDGAEYTGDLAKAWKTMEAMIPSVQTGFMSNSSPKATYSDEWEDPETYPTSMLQGNDGNNPIHAKFSQVYSGDNGLYLMHWLGDVDNWYGYGAQQGKFTFINTFQRGANESCWETVPHPSIEELKYGQSNRGIKGVFTTEATVAKQWAYTNAPDAEDRAIQAVYAANRWGVGDSNITSLAGKMGDQLRNNMFDKYYKEIGTTNKWSASAGYKGAHYLRSWYTSWGGALDGSWTWQIGASHCHEFYQNPLTAFGLLVDDGLKSGMKTGSDAVKDYEISLQRQMEFYLWLQSSDGPIAGGATSSWNGRYEEMKYNAADTAKYGTSTPTKFYNMGYQEHPVYLDPGSNHWIGNQVWAMQRLAELYYVIKTDGDPTGIKAGGLSLEEALQTLLERWVNWFNENVVLEDDGSFAIPATIDWSGQPADWNGKYSATANANLKCEITAYGSSDLGCVSSLANTMIYYAAASGVKPEAANALDDSSAASKGLYVARELLDREWKTARDDIGLSIPETNGSLTRLFEQEVYIPDGRSGQPVYEGTMPSGAQLKNGIKFIDIRPMYESNEKFQEVKAAYDGAGNSAEEKKAAVESVELNYHRFWHAGDIMLALGAMYELYPTVTPDPGFSIDKTEITVAVGETDTITPSKSGCTFESADATIATVDPTTGVVTGVKPGKTEVTVTSPDGEKVICKVTVKDGNDKATLYGDVDCNDKVEIVDVVLLNKHLLDKASYPITDQGKLNADCVYDSVVAANDSAAIQQYLAQLIEYEKLGPQE